MLPSTRRHGGRPTHRSVVRARRWARAGRINSEVRGGQETTGSNQSPMVPRSKAVTAEACRWSFVAPIAMVSGLFGASTAMVIAGLYAQLNTVFGGLAREHILAGAFLALAVGVRVPQRLTMWSCAFVWERLVARNRRAKVSDILVARGSTDRPLYWIVLSGIALLAGVTMALLPQSIVLASACYDWLHVHFVWSAVPLNMLHVALAFGLGFAPLVALGLALSCAHHMSCHYGRWDIRATGWHLLGASVGAGFYAACVRLGVPAGPLLVASSIPVLLVAVLAAGFFSKCRENRPFSDAGIDTLPMRSDRWPTLLRASIVAVGGGAAVCTVISCQLIVAAHARDATSHAAVVPLALMALGVGVLLGCRVKPPGTRTLYGFGLCTLVCGTCVVVASLMLAQQPLFGLWFTMVAAGVMLVVLGYTTGYGRQLLMASVASRSSEGSKMTARLLICVALAIGILVPVVCVLALQFELLVITAMLLVAMGGWLMARDPSGVVRVDRARSGAIAISLALLALLAMWKHSPWRAASVLHGVVQSGTSILKTASPAQDRAAREIAAVNLSHVDTLPIIPLQNGRTLSP